MDAAVASALPPVVFEDGLGKRRLLVGTGNHPLSILILDEELAASPSFEAALTDRIDQLARFEHWSFARVHGAGRLKSAASSLALTSDHVAGVRLSEVLAVAERRLIPLEFDAAFCLIRQVVRAVAALHDKVPGAAHGALGPERIIITSDARVVIVEHVLGPALEQLGYSASRYWRQLRIPLSAFAGAARFDRRTDVTQLGAFALALILGRPLVDDEYPDHIPSILDAVKAISATGLEPLPAGVHAWLRRALQLAGAQSFESAVDARAELDAIDGPEEHEAQQALKSFLVQCDAARVPAPPVSSSPAATVVPFARLDAAPERRTTPSALTEPAGTPSSTPAPFSPAAPAPPPVIPVAPVRSGPHVEVPASVAPARHEPVMVASVTQEMLRNARAPVMPEPVRAPGAGPTDAASVAAPAPAAPHIPESARPASGVGAADTTVPPPAVASVPGGVAAPATAEPGMVPRAAVDAAASPQSSLFNIAPAPSSRHEERPFETDDRDTPEEREARIEKATASGRGRWIAAAAVFIALASGVTLAARWYLAPGSTGTLVVNTSPSGAAVAIDGQQRGATPLTLELSVGQHVLEVGSKGQLRRIPVTIAEGGHVAQFIELATAAPVVSTGQLLVRTEPSGAKVTVDGEARGTTPITIEGLSPGSHSITLENALASVSEQVTIAAGATASLIVPLNTPTNAPVSGWIAIDSSVDIQVYENERLLGSSLSDRIMVSAGRHQLDLVNPSLGYRASRTVEVTPGRVSNIRLDLPKGSVALNAIPWAEVWIDGERIGETPIGNARVAIGSHDVVFRHPELGEQTHKVTVALNAPVRVSADLRKR